MSVAIPTSWLLNRNKIPVRLFSKSGPVRSALFKLIPSCSAAASKTILILFGLCSLKIGWCGKYQVLWLV